MEYTAIGHTVGLAAPMEALAEPGTPYLTAGTAAQARLLFEQHGATGHACGAAAEIGTAAA
jgi:class 3 adenylate cyclase